MLRYDHPNRSGKCDVCGRREINRFASSRYDGPRYCSFRCMAIDLRHVYVAFSILLFIIAFALVVYAVIEYSGWFIFGFVCCLIGCIITVAIAQTGYKGYKERLTADSRKNNLRSTKRNPSRLDKYGTVEDNDLASWREKTKAELKRRELTIQPFELISKGEICMICKLNITKQDIVYQCLSQFHQQHLDEWLKEESTCPVCGCLLAKIDSKKG